MYIDDAPSLRAGKEKPLIAMRLLTLSWHVLALAACANSWAGQPSGGAVVVAGQDASHYCGIYCIYAALHTLEKQPNIHTLLSSAYVGAREGSSIGDLQRAAEAHGAYAVGMQRLTVDMLRASPYPILLHVKPVRPAENYSHWVLFLGVEDGKARILDPPRSVEFVSFAEVLARWDGAGLIVASSPIEEARFVWISRGTFVGLAACAVCGVVILRRLRRQDTARRNPLLVSIATGCGLLFSSVAMAAFWHTASPEGFFFNPRAISSVQAPYVSASLPDLSVEQVREAVNRDDVVLIDARVSRDYALGHIDGAISLPVNASSAERERALADVPQTHRLIVYCQSRGCRWDEEVANVLVANGYKDVCLYSGGWVDWVEQFGQSKEKSP